MAVGHNIWEHFQTMQLFWASMTLNIVGLGDGKQGLSTTWSRHFNNNNDNVNNNDNQIKMIVIFDCSPGTNTGVVVIFSQPCESVEWEHFVE